MQRGDAQIRSGELNMAWRQLAVVATGAAALATGRRAADKDRCRWRSASLVLALLTAGARRLGAGRTPSVMWFNTRCNIGLMVSQLICTCTKQFFFFSNNTK